eukprot:2820634-Ditylum_brightwellii.AAC.1
MMGEGWHFAEGVEDFSCEVFHSTEEPQIPAICTTVAGHIIVMHGLYHHAEGDPLKEAYFVQLNGCLWVL